MREVQLLTIFVMLGGSAAIARQSAMTPMETAMTARAEDDAYSMQMTPEEMRQMQAPETTEQSMRETHVPEPALERPALSRSITPPMMPGMDTDMNDADSAHRVWIENLEGLHGTQNGAAWDAQAWAGGDFDKLWIKSEGASLGAKSRDAKVEALWAHATLPFWDTQLGARHDFSGGASREWAAFGVQGISPYWFDVELTGYVGDKGRTALRLKTEYESYLTQRLILKPEIEFNAYGKADRSREIGAGLSDGQLELRLRYEFSRRFGPYLGYVYARKFAGTASLARAAGDLAVEHRAVAGVEFFF